METRSYCIDEIALRDAIMCIHAIEIDVRDSYEMWPREILLWDRRICYWESLLIASTCNRLARLSDLSLRWCCHMSLPPHLRDRPSLLLNLSLVSAIWDLPSLSHCIESMPQWDWETYLPCMRRCACAIEIDMSIPLHRWDRRICYWDEMAIYHMRSS